MSQATEYLLNRSTAFKASIQKDNITTKNLLSKKLRKQFMKDCHVRDQLLSFYVNDVLGRIKDVTGTEQMIDGFAFLKENMRNCLREKGVYKAISELNVLILWVDAYESSDGADTAENKEGTLFIKHLKSWTEESERKLLLSQIVSLYLEMFELDLWKNSSMKGNVENLKMALSLVKKDSLQASSEKIKTLLDLQKLKMNDVQTQQKAIKDLFCILQELKAITSKQPSSACTRRKRNKERKRRGNRN
uniref:Interleukin-26 n=1 Tax=Geotrypetes seraphini TaxID=260995 RepID=A0A6P8RRS4_GEOSA|nr:interleukin-26 [Geotrypetes seraphini]